MHVPRDAIFLQTQSVMMSVPDQADPLNIGIVPLMSHASLADVRAFMVETSLAPEHPFVFVSSDGIVPEVDETSTLALSVATEESAPFE